MGRGVVCRQHFPGQKMQKKKPFFLSLVGFFRELWWQKLYLLQNKKNRLLLLIIYVVLGSFFCSFRKGHTKWIFLRLFFSFPQSRRVNFIKFRGFVPRKMSWKGKLFVLLLFTTCCCCFLSVWFVVEAVGFVFVLKTFFIEFISYFFGDQIFAKGFKVSPSQIHI